MKRILVPKAKPGELMMRWGRPERGEEPDVCYAWGAGIHKSDAALLHFVIGSPRYGYQGFKEEPMLSLLEELKKRGYDLTTLKLTVKLLPSSPSAASHASPEEK